MKVRNGKKWVDFGHQPPCNPRAMLALPELGHGQSDQIYADRRTGIFWKYNTFDGWMFYQPCDIAPMKPRATDVYECHACGYRPPTEKIPRYHANWRRCPNCPSGKLRWRF